MLTLDTNVVVHLGRPRGVVVDDINAVIAALARAMSVGALPVLSKVWGPR